jgi:hypothetical protein
MFTTTFAASWKLIEMFRMKASSSLSGAEAFTFKIDALLVTIMAALAVIVLMDMIYKLYWHISGRVELIKKTP